MSMQDPIADFLTRMRNGQQAMKKTVTAPSSNMKVAIAKVLQDEGYIEGYQILAEDTQKPELEVTLKYFNGEGVMQKLQRISSPGLRHYVQKNSLPKVMGGFGIAILSTSQGVISDKKAEALGCGGEVICHVA